MQTADLIWMNGDFVAWEDAKVHVLTHGLHYGTGVFEGVRCYDTESHGPAVFRHQEHVNRLFQSASMYYMDIPFTAEQLRESTLELIGRNRLRSCYIRPLVYRGYGTMGLFPLEAPVDVSIAVWEWGSYLGDEGKANGIRARVSSWRRICAGLADPAGQGDRPVPQLDPGEGRGAQVRLRGGDPPRRPRLRVRGHGREPLHRPRRQDLHAAAEQLAARRDQPQVGDPDRSGSRLRGHRAPASRAPSCTSPTSCTAPAPPPS